MLILKIRNEIEAYPFEYEKIILTEEEIIEKYKLCYNQKTRCSAL